MKDNTKKPTVKKEEVLRVWIQVTPLMLKLKDYVTQLSPEDTAWVEKKFKKYLDKKGLKEEDFTF